MKNAKFTKSKSKRSNYNNKDLKEKKVAMEGVKETPNDASWYVVNGQLAKDVASFSFNTALGAPVTIGVNGTDSAVSPATLRMPGIMSIWTTPSCGYSTDASSPVNMAAKNLYSFVRHMNSGSKNYDSPDLMMYILAMDSVYAWYATLTRLYGVARLYSQKNRYYGNVLINALGFNYEEVYSHLADLRYYINQYAIKMMSFCTPVTMSIYRRHVWMYGNLFQDGPTAKSQLYLYNPGFLWKYDELNGAGKLVPVSVFLNQGTGSVGFNASLGWQDIINVSETLIAPMVASEDMNIMSGDILKAYGQENVWKMDMIPEDYVVRPIYSEEILSQIHNTTLAGLVPTNVGGESVNVEDGLTVYQDSTITTGGRLIFEPTFITDATGVLACDKFLDFRKEDPTPEEVLVATRNMLHGRLANISSTSTPKYRIALEACGSEICLCYSVAAINNTGAADLTVFDARTNMSSTLKNNVAKFDQAPIAYDWGTSSNKLTGIFGDIENYTVLDFQDVYDLHSSALLSEFALPLMGTTQK